MVVSVIDDKINYPEVKKIDSDDLQHDASLYEVDINGINIIIALGKPKYLFIDKNIIFFPIYLVKNDKVSSQIGVYEITKNSLPNIIDDDGDVDLEELSSPLIYSFVEESMLKDAEVIQETDDEETDDEDDLDIDDDDLGTDDESIGDPEEVDIDSKTLGITKKPEEVQEVILTNVKGFKEPPPLEEQSKEKALEEQNQPTQKMSWIAAYMKNANYQILDNEGGGDCLFSVIRDGMAGVGKATTVAKLRLALSKEVTEEIFSNYKEHYTMYKGALREANENLKKISEDQKTLKKELQREKDRSQQLEIIKKGKENEGKFRITKQDRLMTKKMYEEYRFMEGIDNTEAFKDIIKTCRFWGETWAISTLERVLNIKLILMSRESYSDGDMDNVLQCGQLNDIILQNRGSFEPSHYIIVDYNGSHFQLIKYKRRTALRFKEIPYDIKKLIIDKCLEKMAGPYSLIKDFVDLKESEGQVSVEIEDDLPGGLFNPEIIFQFYLKSSDRPFPGKGAGEKIQEKDIKNFVELNEIKGWRKMLSNFYVSLFELDGKQWSSVEHYYQASKFKKSNPDFYSSFSLDNPSALSKDPVLAKAAGGKSGKIRIDGKLVELRPKGIEADLDFFGKRKNREMKESQFAKFNQNPALKEMLIKTKDAKLVHHVRGGPPVVFKELMEIRKVFNK